MKIVLLLLAVLLLMSSCAMLASAKTALQEIEGFILLLIAAVLCVGACVIKAIDRASERIANAPRTEPPPPVLDRPVDRT